jgi:hypothetical protein
MIITFNLFFIYGNSKFSLQINFTFCVCVFWFWNKFKVKGIKQASGRCSMNCNQHKTERSSQKNTRHQNCGICLHRICFSYRHIIISFFFTSSLHHHFILSMFKYASQHIVNPMRHIRRTIQYLYIVMVELLVAHFVGYEFMHDNMFWCEPPTQPSYYPFGINCGKVATKVSSATC